MKKKSKALKRFREFVVAENKPVTCLKLLWRDIVNNVRKHSVNVPRVLILESRWYRGNFSSLNIF